MTLGSPLFALLALVPPVAGQVAPAPLAAGTAPAAICLFERSAAIAQSQAGQDGTRQMKELLAAMGREIDTQRQALIADGKALEAKRALLPPDQFRAQNALLAQRDQSLQQLIQTRASQLDRTKANAEQQIDRVIDPALRAASAARNCGLLMARSAVIDANPAMDLTPQVVADVNRRLPSIRVELASPTPPQ